MDNAGNLYAYSGTFEGAVNAGSIRYGVQPNGVDYGTLSGGGITSRSIGGGNISYAALDADHMIKGVRDALSNGNYAANLFGGIADYNASIKIGTVSCTTLYQDGCGFTKKSVTIKDYYGDNVTISYWG